MMMISKIVIVFKIVIFVLVVGVVVLGLVSFVDVVVGIMYGDLVVVVKYWCQQIYDDCVLMLVVDVIG